MGVFKELIPVAPTINPDTHIHTLECALGDGFFPDKPASHR